MQRVVVAVRLVGRCVLGRLIESAGKRAPDASVVEMAVNKDKESVCLDDESIKLIAAAVGNDYDAIER